MPALTRYDGPFFRILRRFLSEQSSTTNPHVFILSAEYGLISSQELIDLYDRRMTKDRALKLQEQVQRTFSELWEKGEFSEIFVCLGKDYEAAMSKCWELVPNTVTTHVAQGSIGGRGSQLKRWLWKNQILNNQKRSIKEELPVQLKGIPILHTKQQIIDIAASNCEKTEASRFQTWYVLVGDKRVGAKWLVSQITGLSVSKFTTSDALRILENHGIKVDRNE